MLRHNRGVGSSTENRDVSTHHTVKKRVHWMLAWKTQIWEKPRQPSDCKISLCQIFTMMGHRDNDLLLPCFATRRLEQRQRPLPLSLSLCTLLRSTSTLYIQPTNKISLGHIYTNMTFGLFTNVAPVGSMETYLHICPFHPRRGSYRACTIRFFSLPIRRDLFPNKIVIHNNLHFHI